MANQIKIDIRSDFLYEKSTTINYFRFFMAFCAERIGGSLNTFVENDAFKGTKSYPENKRKELGRTRFNPKKSFNQLYDIITGGKIPDLNIDDSFITDFVKGLNVIEAMPPSWANQTIDSGNFKVFLYELMVIGHQPDITPKENEQYIEQSLCSAESSERYELNRIGEILSNKQKICIVGEGGLGKTTFLKRIENTKSRQKAYKKIIYLHLRDDILSQLQQQPCKDKFLLNYIQNQSPGSTSVLLLIDGFDEFLSHTDSDSYIAIINDLKKLSSNPQMKIITTSRYMAQELSVQAFEQYTLNYVPEDNIKVLWDTYKNMGIKKEIKELLKIPMYYSLFKNRDPKDVPHNQYDLFFYAYKYLYVQRHKKDSESHYHYLYFYLLPKLLLSAYNKRVMKGRVIGDSNEITEIINVILEKKASKDIEYAAVTDKIGIKTFTSTENSLDAKRILELLTEDDLLLMKDGKYHLGNSINHQYWRAFLVAFSLITSMNCLRQSHGNDKYAKEYVIDFNVPTEAINMVCTHLFPSFFETAKSEKEKDTKRKHLEQEFRHYFEQLPIAPQLFDSCCGFVKYCHMAFYLANTFQFERIISEERNSAYFDVIERGFNAAINADSEEQPFFRKEMIELITKMAELSRKGENYGIAMTYINNGIELLQNNNGGNMDKFEVASFANQKAKILLYQHRHSCLTYPDNKKLINHDSFREALKSIEECAEYFTVSANLYGRMHTTPALYLREADLLELKPIDAFYKYYKCGIKRVGRHLEYTLRQAVSLLLRGVVKLKDDYVYKEGISLVKINDLELGNFDTYQINSSTLSLARDLCSFTPNHSLGHWDYLLGTLNHVSYLISSKPNENHKKAAELFFDRPDSNGNKTILSVIRKKQLLSHEYEKPVKEFLDNQDSEMKKATDQPDRLHPLYIYIDVKNLVLSYEHYRGNITELNKYESLFRNYEEKKLNQLCQKIANEQTVKFE